MAQPSQTTTATEAVDTMVARMLSLADDAWPVLQRLAAQHHSTVEAVLTELVRAEGDRSLPRARESRQRRVEIAEGLLRQLGIDPEDGDY